MKYKKDGEAIPETALEAVEQLETFFENDICYAKHAEWKTDEKIQRYLKGHFKICKDAIKKIEMEKKECVHTE